MICCHFISISGEEEFECCNCQQPRKQSAIPTPVLPSGKGAKIRRFPHRTATVLQKQGVVERATVVEDFSGWIGKCASIKKSRGQSKTKTENK